jgi:predicted enzyme related to lactoylglutathione lyase
MRLSGVMLNSETPTALAEFYTKVLGAPAWQQGEMYGYGTMESSFMVMGHSELKGSTKEPQRVLIPFVCDNIAADFARIVSYGAGVVAEPYSPNPSKPEMQIATLSDPDGNYIQLSTPWEM